MNSMFRLSVLASALLVLNACTTAPAPKVSEPMVAEPIAAAPKPVRAFPADTFYSLLVAELAGNRERFDIALGNYVQQAYQTRDPGVVARAARIARFLDVRGAALDMSTLWAEVEPTNNEARVLAASELSEVGRLEEAFVHARYLLTQGNPLLLQTVAAFASKGTDLQREQLLVGLQSLLPRYEQTLELWMAFALLHQQQEQVDLAVTAVAKAAALNPEHLQAQALQARIRYDQGDQVGGLRQMAGLVNDNDADYRLRLQYARMLAATDLGGAGDQFVVLVEQSPGDPDLLFSLALIRFEQKRYEDATPLLEQMLSDETRSSSAHFYLARIAHLQGDVQGALNHYLKVELGQDFMSALVQTLDILVAAGETQAAHARMQAVRAKVPQQQERLFALEAEIYSKYLRFDQAEAILTQGLEAVPSSTRLLYSRAMVNERRNMIDLTELDLRKVIRYEPNNATALNALGYTLADKTDRYAEALELIRRAHSLKPRDPAIVDSLGWVQFRLGNLEESILRLREAFKMYPDAEIASHLGEVLWVSGDQQQARSVWQQGLALDPDSDIIPAVMRRLDVPH